MLDLFRFSLIPEIWSIFLKRVNHLSDYIPVWTARAKILADLQDETNIRRPSRAANLVGGQGTFTNLTFGTGELE